MASKTSYCFPKDIRDHMRGLCNLMEYANSRDDGRWAQQSSSPAANGVYGALASAVHAIMVELHGAALAKQVMAKAPGLYGASGSWLLDLEEAAQQVLDEQTQD
jgi:hypothetical protein